jgi:CRISPR-associated protein Cmr2
MANYVFSLGLIPVQDWIAQARRSRDLRAGSAFLCHLMQSALGALAADPGVEVLLPDVAAHPLQAPATLEQALTALYGIPNRASGYCEAPSSEDVGRRLDAATHGTLKEAWKTFRGDFLCCSPGGNKWEKRFWELLEPYLAAYLAATPEGEDCPFSFVWAAMPVPFPREDRRSNLRAIETLYVDVKRTRPIRPGIEGHPIGKCNQCGAREAIGPTSSFEAWRAWYERLGQEQPWVKRGVRLDAGERLCYVCLAKRMAGYACGDNFPSTGEIAARPWRVRAGEDRDLARLLERLAATDFGRSDLALALRASPRQFRERDAQDAATLQREIRQHLLDHPELALPQVPPAYLALLTFDGDEMGRRVRDDPDGVPRKMAEFARRAGKHLLDEGGVAFYLAGDEGLAMAPAATALDLALDLRAAFRDAFGEAVTLSMGIAFFEHSRPMAGAIRAARAALNDAKRLDGKDALGVTVETASGNLWSLAERWAGGFWERLRLAGKLIRERELSAGWAYDVETFLETIPAEAWREAGVPAAVRAEVKRLLYRRLARHRETADDRRRRSDAAWEALHGETWWVPPPGGKPRPLPEQLHLVGFLGRQRTVEESVSEPPQ